jgi:CBS domain-containing protein
MYIPPQLVQAKDRLATGEVGYVPTSPRELVGWFMFSRRTWRQSRYVQSALQSIGLISSPDFEGVGYDDIVFLVQAPTADASIVDATTTTTTPSPSLDTVASPGVSSATSQPPSVDPVHRVSRFLPPLAIVSVSRDESLQVAVTQMLLNDFSQIPVMQGESKVAGMISWRSIGERRALGLNPMFVRECLDPHYEVKAGDSIFDAIRVIQEKDCVLVRSHDNKIVGILTATDISGSFEQLSRPFLLLSYVENHLRSLIKSRFSIEELQSAKDPADAERTILDVSDMTFGEYVRLLERPDNWSKLNIGIERSLFIGQLNEVREIRNDVMHFNPEGIEEKDMETLRRFSSFLQSIVSLLPSA